MKQPLTLEQLVKRVTAAWDAARGSRSMPRRSEIDPVKLGPALQFLMLLDVVPGDPIDFRYRLVGQHLQTGYGLDLTGKLHTAMADPSRSAWPFYEAYTTCATTKRPLAVDITAYNRKKLSVNVKGHLWPLSDDGENVDCLLGAAMYFLPAALAATKA